MMQITSMAVLAGLMSRKYNINVQVSGNIAYTHIDPDTGKVTINIPAAEYEDDKYLGYVRGYIDHEVGHVKYTRHDKLGEALTGAAPNHQMMRKNIWNILEDTYVERMMMQDFAGCGRNLRNLVRLVFGEPGVEVPRMLRVADYIGVIMNYILFNQRSRLYPFLSDKLDAYRGQMETFFPGLADVINLVMDDAWKENDSTEHNLQWANRITDAILATVPMPEQQEQGQGQGQGQQGQGDKALSARTLADEIQGELNTIGNDDGGITDAAAQDIAGKVLQVVKSMDSMGDSRIANSSVFRPFAGESRENMSNTFKQAYVRATTGAKYEDANIVMRVADNKQYLRRLSAAEKQEALLVTAKLSAQLKALLQTYVMNRGGAFRRGHLDSNRLARLTVNDQRIFQQRVQQRGLDTEIVILMDMSGSMSSQHKDVISSEALYAVTHALHGVKGIRVAVYGFSHNDFISIKEFNQPAHENMRLDCTGGTYAGEATMLALSKFSWREGTRRIFIAMTDGDTYNPNLFDIALKRVRKAGVEVVGVGICDTSMEQYVSKDEYVPVNNIKEFPAKLFAILRGKLVRNLA